MVPKTKPKRHLTIITGLICDDAILMACDSRTTEGSIIRDDAVKISILKSGIGDIIFGRSGSEEYGLDCVERIRSAIVGKSFKVARDVVEVVDRVVQEARRNLIGQHQKEESAIRDFKMGLMYAFYLKNKPNIWRVSFELPVSNQCNSQYACIGNAPDLGEFLLKQYSLPDMKPAFGFVISALTIQRIKDNVSGCGGPIRIATLNPYRLSGAGIKHNDIPDDIVPEKYGHMVRYALPSAMLVPLEWSIDSLAKIAVEIDDEGRNISTLNILRKLNDLANKWKEEINP